jgi:hypothetical protein
LAARAYNVVQDFLLYYRTHRKYTRDTPKEELVAVFAEARRAADDAVKRMLLDDINHAIPIMDDNDDDEDDDVDDESMGAVYDPIDTMMVPSSSPITTTAASVTQMSTSSLSEIKQNDM